jgi:hypothetical protein
MTPGDVWSVGDKPSGGRWVNISAVSFVDVVFADARSLAAVDMLDARIEACVVFFIL